MVQNQVEGSQETEPVKPIDPITLQTARRASTPFHHQVDEELQSPTHFQEGSQHPLTSKDGSEDPPHHWFKSWAQVLSPVAWLENKSSVARDHLANERTFLAWFRTSLSLTSIGVALVQLSRLAKQNHAAQVDKLISAIQPIIGLLSNPNVSNVALHDVKDPADQSSSSQATLVQINEKLMNLQSTIDLIHRDVDTIKRTKNLASVIGNCYVCIGFLFLVIGTHRYFRVQKILQTGHFPHSRRSIGLTTLIVSVLLILTAVGMFRANF